MPGPAPAAVEDGARADEVAAEALAGRSHVDAGPAPDQSGYDGIGCA